MSHRPPRAKLRYFICTLDTEAVDLKYLIATKQKVSDLMPTILYAKAVFKTFLEMWAMDQEAWEAITGNTWPGAQELDDKERLTVIEIREPIAQSLINTRAMTCHNDWDLEGYDQWITIVKT